MGGAIALKALLKEPRQWDGIVLVAPMCKVILPSLLCYTCGWFVSDRYRILIAISWIQNMKVDDWS